MVKTAFLFSGQGAQTVGMGQFAVEFDPAKRLFDRASRVLGFDLLKICLEGPQETLNRTDVCQPALLVHGLAALEWQKSRAELPEPEAAAGLSLGEYTAHVFAGSLPFEEGVSLVMKRGRFMQEACDATPSGMVTVLGLDRETIAKAIEGLGDVGIANLNCPGQIVISGENHALEAATAKVKAAGARRAVPLKVAGAYHSVVMKPAQEKMRAELASVKILRPRIPVYANVNAKPLTDSGEIRAALATQICGSVLWEDSIRAMGAKKFYEFGPGGILAGLVRKIDDTAEIVSIE